VQKFLHFLLFSSFSFYLTALILQNFIVLKRYILSLALLLPALVHAQKHHEAGLSFGVANYTGDLQDRIFPSSGFHPLIGASYKIFMTPRVGLRFGATFTSISGADSLSDIKANFERNLNFTSRVIEAHGGLEYNFWPIDRVRSRISPYVFAGIGVFYSNPFTNGMNGEKVFLKHLSTEGQGLPTYPDRKPYSNVNVSFPFGAGMKFLVNKTLVISAEMGFRPTTTDYLDDVSNTYIDPSKQLNEKGIIGAALADPSYNLNEGAFINKAGYQRGNPDFNDFYFVANISVTYRIFTRIKCARFY
jgi:hypothetical protein